MRKKFFNYVANFVALVISTITVLFIADFIFKNRLIIAQPLTSEGRVDFVQLFKLSTLARGDSYDDRTPYQVVLDERSLNPHAFPAVSPAYFLDSNGSRVLIDGTPVLPLGITAVSDNFYCNESGKYAKFSTDKFGFRNKQSVWREGVDVVAVGDSFTMGSCLDADQSIVGQIEKSGKKIVNLGMGANGPLLELASLIEYGIALKPKIILWNFFANDIFDLENEKNNPILKEYFKDGYSQQLKKRADQINIAVDQVVDEYWKQLEAISKNKTSDDLDQAYFPNIRKVYRYFKNQKSTTDPNFEENLQLVLQILSRTQKEARLINSELYFVYLPDCIDGSYGQAKWKTKLLDGVRKIGIKVIDLTPVLDELKQSGQEAFFACPGSHYNPAGARAAALEIIKHIK